MNRPIRGSDNPLRDPGITVGAYRVLERTDGRFILFDERLPANGSVAWLGKTKEAAVREAHRLVGLGSPVVLVNRSLAQAPARRVAIAADGADAKTPRRRA